MNRIDEHNCTLLFCWGTVKNSDANGCTPKEDINSEESDKLKPVFTFNSNKLALHQYNA